MLNSWRMNTYHVDSVGTGFQVVEDLPNGGRSFLDGFSTRDDAQGWLDSFQTLIGLIDCRAEKAAPHQSGVSQNRMTASDVCAIAAETKTA